MSAWPRAERVRGLWNMGRPQVPPLPMWIVMEDRATGIQYVLKHTGDPGSLVLDLSTTLPARNRAVYGPYEGPYLNGRVRLYIENGTLSSEVPFPAPGNWGPRVFARRANQRLLLEITASADGTLSYTEVEV